LRLLRQHAGDIGLVIRLNAQYGSMVRTSLSVHARLMRVQALRHKRDAIDGAATEDARVQHVAEQSMLRVVDADAARLAAASPVPAAWPLAAPVGTPAVCVDQRTADNVSQDGINSHDAAFETWLSEQPWNRGPGRSGETPLQEVVRKAIAISRSAGPESPANGRETPGRAA
jgi:hypothetical protein